MIHFLFLTTKIDLISGRLIRNFFLNNLIFSVSMNKIVVGTTASPNLKQVRSKIGSLDNAAYKPGGGEVKIESRKLEWKTTARTSNFNDGYAPKGGDKKVKIRFQNQTIR